MRLTEAFRNERQDGESFQAWSQRIGKRALRDRVEDLINAGLHDPDPSLFQDWGDPRTYSIDDLGVGECAGEVISPLEFGLAASEQKVFEAQLALEAKQPSEALAKSRLAMIEAARAMLKHSLPFARVDDEAALLAAFREQLQDGGRFGGLTNRFALQLLRANDGDIEEHDLGAVHQRIGEAQAFLEAAYEFQTKEMNA